MEARSACACARAEGAPEAPTPGSVCGVPANCPFIAANALCACTSCDSMLLISDRAASMRRSEEHTSELQSLMRISYAVFCLKKKKNQSQKHTTTYKHESKVTIWLV